MVKAVNDMQISIVDLTNILNRRFRVGVAHEVCPPGGHNHHGQVERSIKEVKKLFVKLFSQVKLDILSYETAFAFISNEINCIPLCLSNTSSTENLEDLDLITPSRLLLGRNNRQALAGFAKIEKPTRIMKQLDSVYKAWWDTWFHQKLSDFIPRNRKWTENKGEVKVGDIVIFQKLDKEQHFGSAIWKIGKVVDLHVSKDGQVTQVNLKYRNSTEKVFRTVTRSVRSLAVLHREDDVFILDEYARAYPEAENLVATWRLVV